MRWKWARHPARPFLFAEPFRNSKKCGNNGIVVSPDSLPLEAILLAGGRSRRMAGVNKLLLCVDGMAMVRRSALLYLDLGISLTVVTGSDDGAVAAELAGLDVRLVANPNAECGQHSSVRAGLVATPLTAPGLLVALADQPLLTTTDIRALVAEFARHAGTRICVPRFAGDRGNPVIFPGSVARHLRDPGSMPPRAFIDAYPAQVAWFDAANDHFTRDVDTPEDAADLIGAPSLLTRT